MKLEATAIRLSATGNFFFCALGIAVGIWVDSAAILLDGIFNGISFGMALLTLKVASLVKRPADDNFHFGYAFFEPLVNLVKSCLVIGVAVFALFGAIDTLLEGGQAIDPGPAIGYAAIAVAGCIALALFQRNAARKTKSPLLDVDAKNWFVNGAISSAVGAAFLVAMLIRGGSWDHIVPYVDPALVCLLVVLTLPIPVRMAIDALGELLNVAPKPEIQQEVRAQFEAATAGHGFEQVGVRMVRVGRHFYLMATAILPDSFKLDKVAKLDGIREDITKKMSPLHPYLVLDILFTGETKWIR